MDVLLGTHGSKGSLTFIDFTGSSSWERRWKAVALSLTRALKRLVLIAETCAWSGWRCSLRCEWAGRASCLKILLSTTPGGSCPSSTKGLGNLQWGNGGIFHLTTPSALLGFHRALDSLFNVALQPLKIKDRTILLPKRKKEKEKAKVSFNILEVKVFSSNTRPHFNLCLRIKCIFSAEWSCHSRLTDPGQKVTFSCHPSVRYR